MSRGFLSGSVVKNPSAIQETRFWSLGWEDPLEEKMATHSSILAWKIPWTDEPGGLQSMGPQRVGYNWGTLEGNGSPLQYSCLENPVDRGAWWAAVHSVAQSWTWLKRLSMHACIGEGNGNPLQYSCLENPRDGGAWWAAVHRVAQSQTRLKQLSSSSRGTWAHLMSRENHVKKKNVEASYVRNKSFDGLSFNKISYRECWVIFLNAYCFEWHGLLWERSPERNKLNMCLFDKVLLTK